MPKATSHRSKPSVSIIGAGRLGRALAIALASSGYSVLAMVARHATTARKAARRLNGSHKTVRALGANQLEQLPPSDLLFIATPDDEIGITARRLADSAAGSDFEKTRHRIVLHTSGALSSQVLSPLAASGFHTGSMHPLVSVSDPQAGARALRGAFYCLEGDPVAMRLARKVVKDLEGQAFSITPESKALYHAAAVMASPHLVALFDLATEMLAACGLSKRKAKEILLPLLESTVSNLKVSASEKALTGTFARGDLATVQRHLAVMSRTEVSKDLAGALEVYKLLGLRSLQLADRNGVEPQVLNQIRKLLTSKNKRN